MYLSGMTLKDLEAAVGVVVTGTTFLVAVAGGLFGAGGSWVMVRLTLRSMSKSIEDLHRHLNRHEAEEEVALAAMRKEFFAEIREARQERHDIVKAMGEVKDHVNSNLITVANGLREEIREGNRILLAALRKNGG